MLVITNNFNVPEELYRAAQNDDHVTNGDISVTTLLDAPQIRILKKNNKHYQDVCDNIYAMIGTAFHSIQEDGCHKHRGYNTLKKAYKVFKDAGLNDLAKQTRDAVKLLYPDEIVDKDIILERTLSLPVTGINDITKEPYTVIVSGTQDFYQKSTKTLKDHKVTSVIKGDKIQDAWEKQLNIYAYMLRQSGEEVERIQVNVFFRDYNKMREKWMPKKNVGAGANYPKAPIRVYDIRIWSDAECLKYLQQRVHLHYMAEQGVVPECTNKEMWSDNDIYAVCGSNFEKSLKNFHSLKDAHKFLEETDRNVENPFIEFRPANRFRCNNYCPVNHVCPQKKKHVEFIKLLK